MKLQEAIEKAIKEVEKIKLGEIYDLQQNFIDSIDNYQKQLQKIKDIITKHPYHKRSFELVSYVFQLRECINTQYKNLIECGILTTKKMSVWKGQEIYELAFQLYKQIPYNLDKGIEIHDNLIIEENDLNDQMLTNIEFWEKNTNYKKTMNQLYEGLQKYINLSHEIKDDESGIVIEVRYTYFDIKDTFDEIENKIYSNMHNLFKSYYEEFETRTEKLTDEDKIKYQKYESIINDFPFVNEQYEEYKQLRRFGPNKKDPQIIEKYMKEEEFEKPKSKMIIHGYRNAIKSNSKTIDPS